MAVWGPAGGRGWYRDVLGDCLCRPACAGDCPGVLRRDSCVFPTVKGWGCVCVRPLVPVSSTPRGASTSGLSTTWSHMGPSTRECVRNPYLGAGFPLRCFQRLSLPNVANQPCRWRDNWHTRGSSTQVLSYYGQVSSRFQRAQRIETKLSHDVLNPARVPL